DQSHSQFQGALMYLAEPGNLQDIGAQFGRAADTLQSMTEIIISNDNMLTEMYKNAGNVLTKWAEQRYLVEESYEKISSVLIRWTEQEQVHREQIEHRLFDRLSELEKTEKNFEKGFNDLKTINESLHNSIQEVQRVVDKIAKNVSETTEIQQEVSQSQKNTAHELQTISKDVRENYSKYTEVLNHLKTMFADLLNNEKQTLKALEVQQKKIIEGMEAMGRQILNNMKTSQLAYDQFWKEYKALLPVGATSEEQAKQTKILIALVMVQSVAMVITAAAIFLR
ncbi:MAG TPA: hypothetical protein VJL89_10590, partial [Thermodesulfovibrionia bacterium]|nr:hypothetical protein [Thermodesulfovibrionia bacterium]